MIDSLNQENCSAVHDIFDITIILSCMIVVIIFCYKILFPLVNINKLPAVLPGNPVTAVAQYHLAEKYIDGKVVRENFVLANYWLHKSAKKGYLPAEIAFGNSYLSGLGLPYNVQKARFWLLKAARKGNATAEEDMGASYGLPQGLSWYQKAAHNGSVLAQMKLYKFYHSAKYGLQQDTKAIYWLGKAAKQKDIWAQYILGQDYYLGRDGKPQDSMKAMFLLNDILHEKNYCNSSGYSARRLRKMTRRELHTMEQF